jgi:hypothetical protein
MISEVSRQNPLALRAIIYLLNISSDERCLGKLIKVIA